MSERLSILKDVLESARRADGVSRDALTVLAAVNDPYRQDTPTGHSEAAWFAEQFARGFGGRRVHLRGLHYSIVARGDILKPDGKPYVNDDDCWTWLGGAAKAARWLGYVDFDRIVDNRNAAPELIAREELEEPSPRVYAEFDAAVPSVDDIGVDVSAGAFVGRQKYSLVFFGEKSSLGDELAPLAKRFDADLYLPSGEISDTLLHVMAQRGNADGRPMVIFTLADFDPAGHQMPVSIARKLQALRDLKYPDLSFTVIPIGLNVDQVKTMGLPSTPLKETEKRADRWREHFGLEQTEIDALAALRPGALREMVIEAIGPFFDETLVRRVDQARREWEEAAREAIDEEVGPQVEAIRDRAAPVLAQLQAEIVEINSSLREAVEDLSALPPMHVPEANLDPEKIGSQAILLSSDWGWAAGTRALKARKTYGSTQ